MKGNLISLLQTRMDKCTTEQFWVVGVSTGLSAFLISQSEIIQKSSIPDYAVIVVQAFLSFCVICFVVHRHICFYNLERQLSGLLEYEMIAPKTFRQKHDWWQWQTLSGVGFYIFWTLLTCAGVISCYCPKSGTCCS